MEPYEIEIKWDGPFRIEEVIEEMDNAGDPPDYEEGEDYGLYQIYGKHILCGADTLLYIGQSTSQTFSWRLNQHNKEWLQYEEDIQVYLGRVYDPKKHSKTDKLESWESDIKIAEKILIYKYSPNHNNREISEPPKLPFENIRLIHGGKRHKLESEDNAPKDYS